jgi:ATP-dependent helicase YprA (DUF1998 family)
MLFDECAGGSGCVARLWNCFFSPASNILEAAIELLEECSFCRIERGYDGGCPACLHASNCNKFNMHLSRSAAIVIGKRTLERIKATDLYQQKLKDSLAYESKEQNSSDSMKESANDTTPRKKSRNLAMRNAKEMHNARKRQFVIGRPTWPLDM